MKIDKYILVNYHDTWYSDDEGWQVNDLHQTEVVIELKEHTDEEIVSSLVEAGFLKPEVKVEDIDIWNDYDIIEFYNAENSEPIGRLERV